MTGLDIGVGLTHWDAIPQFAQEAESRGFDALSCGEHLFFHRPTPNALVALAVAAGATSSIALVSAVVLAPLYPPALLAKMASVLDVASGGRLRLGVGVGGEFPAEFEAVGVPVGERGARTDEALAVITGLFRGEGGALVLSPPPAQPGGPPIWVAGRSEAAMRRAGRWASAWMPYLCTPEQLREGLATARSHATAAGRPAGELHGVFYAMLTVYPDAERAREVVTASIGATYRQDFSRRTRYLVFGTPDECVERLQEYRRAGATTILLNLVCPPEDAAAMLALVADEVVPALRADG